jgi:hypothetical protein
MEDHTAIVVLNNLSMGGTWGVKDAPSSRA